MDTLKLITQKISKKKCYQTEVQILEKSENMSINDQKYIVNQIELASLKHPHEMKEFSKLIEENFNYKWQNSRWKVVIHKGTKLSSRKFLKSLIKRGFNRTVYTIKMIILNGDDAYILACDKERIYYIYRTSVIKNLASF